MIQYAKTYPTHSIDLQQTSYKSALVTYREGERLLTLYLELASGNIDLVGSTTDLEKWKQPLGEPITPQKQAEITQRIIDFTAEHKTRIGIGPPMDMGAYFRDLQQKGWTVEHRPDGTVHCARPNKAR